MAHNKSSPLIVFLFSLWHLSLALQINQPLNPKILTKTKSNFTNKQKLNLLAGDEANKFRDAFLNGLLGILGDLTIGRKRLLHDPANISDR